jgi:hypothetical protein
MGKPKIKKRCSRIVARNRIEAIMGYKQKVISLDDEMLLQLEQQKENFRKKFGRDPGPADPVFFDPKCETPTPYTEERLKEILSEAARKSGVSQEKVMAFLDAFDNADDETREVWAKEFREIQERKKGPS